MGFLQTDTGEIHLCYHVHGDGDLREYHFEKRRCDRIRRCDPAERYCLRGFCAMAV